MNFCVHHLGGRKKPITIIKIGKSKIGKKRNLGKFQNQEISKPSPNNGANERPKGDFKASVPIKIRIFKYQNYGPYTILQPQNEVQNFNLGVSIILFCFAKLITAVTSLGNSPLFWAKARQLQWAKQIFSHYCSPILCHSDARFCRFYYYVYWNVYDWNAADQCLLSVSYWNDYCYGRQRARFPVLDRGRGRGRLALDRRFVDFVELRGASTAAFSSPLGFGRRCYQWSGLTLRAHGSWMLVLCLH